MSNILSLKLYDDSVHIDAACDWINGFHSSYRPLVYEMTCFVGGSVVSAKILSIVLLVLSALIWIHWVLKPFHENEAPLQKGGRFLLFLHPVAVFPIFYASQVSMALTWFWATAGLAVVRRWNQASISIPFWILWSFIGMQLRFENLYILIYLWLGCVSFQFLFNHIRPPLKEMISLGTAFCAFYLWEGLNKLNWLNWTVWTPAADITPAALDYPRESFLNIQAHAQFLYLKNLLWPFDMSFLGPWLQWWKIHTLNDGRFATGAVALILLLSLISFLTKIPRPIRMISFAVLCGFLATIAQSTPRVPDWYFVSRQTIPAALTMGLLGLVPTRPRLTFGLGMVALGASLFHLFFHFASTDRFLEFESRISAFSPAYHLNLANQLLKSNRPDEAKLEFYNAYQMIPKESPWVSSTAAQYMSLALFGGIHSSLLEKDIDSAKSAGIALWNLKNDFSVYGCLRLAQNKIMIAPQCFPSEEKYKKAFCLRTQKPLFAEYVGKDTLRPIAESIHSYCRSL